MAPGTLYLIPVPLGGLIPSHVIPVYNTEIINSLEEFIAEDIRTARRHLKLMGITARIETLLFHELGKHSDPANYKTYLAGLLEGKSIGLLSDAGCPGVADPRAAVVKLAHEHGIPVVPLTGPSSILLALMASGSNGQQFAFHGYLPKERPQRARKIKDLERALNQSGQTQIFIETPFRNEHLFEDLLSECREDTLLCVACDITLPTQFIRTRRISEWKKHKPQLQKRPAVFLLCS